MPTNGFVTPILFDPEKLGQVKSARERRAQIIAFYREGFRDGIVPTTEEVQKEFSFPTRQAAYVFVNRIVHSLGLSEPWRDKHGNLVGGTDKIVL